MQPRTAYKKQIMSCARGHVNDGPLSSMLATWMDGDDKMPNWLGLDRLTFRRLVRFQFPQLQMRKFRPARTAVSNERAVEWRDLKKYLLKNRARNCASEIWIAEIVSSACMGQNHLWQDLGLQNRTELTALMENNFPKMAKRNVHNMKWKKFIYRELCQTEGIYVCRSPSCDVCVDYDECFGPEE
ncbi:MAG: nitrogen fixation protein NifQ [Methylocystaceae bacterium]|nr:nitrogen fixation protein NifQ [Methylocystaceae bacterium]